MKTKWLWIAFIVLALSSLFVGVKDLRPWDMLHWTSEQQQVFWISRVPRLISIIIAGSCMSIAGLIMQQLSRNKFVSPTTAGTLEWTRLGILVAMMLFASASPLMKMSVAFVFALIGTFLFMQILNRIHFKDTIFIPLVGLMLGNVVSSIATYFAYRYDLVQNISSWLQGNFSLVLQGRYELLYISVPLIVVAYAYASKFTLAGMGEDFATNLGMNYKTVVTIGLIIVALISASVVLTVGSIPFLGLIIPNVVSIYRGDHLKNSLIHTALLGASFVLVCDVLGRLIIYPYEIPIGVMVGVIGSGIFLYLLLRRDAYAAAR